MSSPPCLVQCGYTFISAFYEFSVTKTSAWYFQEVFLEQEQSLYVLEKYEVENWRGDQKIKNERKWARRRIRVWGVCYYSTFPKKFWKRLHIIPREIHFQIHQQRNVELQLHCYPGSWLMGWSCLFPCTSYQNQQLSKADCIKRNCYSGISSILLALPACTSSGLKAKHI